MGGAREEILSPKDYAKPGSSSERARPRSVTDPEGDVLQEGVPDIIPPAAVGGNGEPVTVTTAHATLTAFLQSSSAKPPDAGRWPPGYRGQDVRIHEEEGSRDIHFHVNAEGLKVAIPKGDMWSIWERLQRLGREQYLDTVNGTLLTLLTQLETRDGEDYVDLYVSVTRCKPKFGKVFTKMDRTISGKAARE